MDATLDDIARRAGVGPGTLYRHFPDRESLLAAVYRDEIIALCARTDALAETLPPDEALVAGCGCSSTTSPRNAAWARRSRPCSAPTRRR